MTKKNKKRQDGSDIDVDTSISGEGPLAHGSSTPASICETDVPESDGPSTVPKDNENQYPEKGSSGSYESSGVSETGKDETSTGSLGTSDISSGATSNGSGSPLNGTSGAQKPPAAAVPGGLFANRLANRRPGMPASVMETRVSIRASRAPAYMFNENTDLMVIPPLRNILTKDQFRNTLSVANKQLSSSKHLNHVWNHSVWSVAYRGFSILFYVIVVLVLVVVLYDGQQEGDTKYIYTMLAGDVSLWLFIATKFILTQRRGRKICEKVAGKAGEKLPGKEQGIIKVGCEWTGLDYVLQIDVRMVGRRGGPAMPAAQAQ